jgi:hypothetical protein
MTLPKLESEPYENSIHFYCALREKGLRLEAQARKDELFAASLEHPVISGASRQRRIGEETYTQRVKEESS